MNAASLCVLVLYIEYIYTLLIFKARVWSFVSFDCFLVPLFFFSPCPGKDQRRVGDPARAVQPVGRAAKGPA